MAFFFPEVHREIDWTQPHDPLEQELLEITPASEQGRRMADKLIKVRRTSGREEWVLVHIEFQSQPEAEFARRMYVYNYRLFDRYNHEFEREKGMTFITTAERVGIEKGLAEGLAKGREEGREDVLTPLFYCAVSRRIIDLAVRLAVFRYCGPGSQLTEE